MITIPMDVKADAVVVSMSVSADNETIGMSVGAEYAVARPKLYEGAYEFTPTSKTQTIAINDKMALQDITINPIPSNYGLITWNGSELVVS